MYGDQFGEFVCGYWGFKGYYKHMLDYEINNNIIMEPPSQCKAGLFCTIDYTILVKSN